MNIAKPLSKLAIILATKKFLDIDLSEYKAAAVYHSTKTLSLDQLALEKSRGIL